MIKEYDTDSIVLSDGLADMSVYYSTTLGKFVLSMYDDGDVCVYEFDDGSDLDHLIDVLQNVRFNLSGK